MLDPWDSGTSYERFMGRWSRPLAAEFLRWLQMPADQAWLDVGCGTGSMCRLILEGYGPVQLLGVDQSPAFIQYARQALADGVARFEVGDAQSLPAEADCFDVTVSGLMLNFVPRPELALAEMRRVTRSGGTAAVFVWDYGERMEMLRYFWDAAVALEPAAAALDEAVRFPLCRPEALQALWVEAGLTEVTVQGLEVPTRFADFDDYWRPFLGQVGPAPAWTASLSGEQRTELANELRTRLPVAADGSISLVARAWAVRGKV